MTLSTADKADILVQALPYIQKYTDKIVVIKYGGNAMVDESLKQAVMSDLVLLTLVGIKVVLGARRRPGNQRNPCTAWVKNPNSSAACA